MSLQTRSEPLRCPDCNSGSIQVSIDAGEDYLICHDCGVLWLEDAEEDVDLEITASIVCCPHCETVDEIRTYGGAEQCNVCGLDPDRRNYPIEELAHLWRGRRRDDPDDKLIREIMQKLTATGEERFSPTSGIGIFLRSECGPHCSSGMQCPQTTKDLAGCWRQSRLRDAGDDEMSKRKRGKKGHKHKKSPEEKAARKAARAAFEKLHSRSWLFTPNEGWFVSIKNYESETIYRERAKT